MGLDGVGWVYIILLISCCWLLGGNIWCYAEIVGDVLTRATDEMDKTEGNVAENKFLGNERDSERKCNGGEDIRLLIPHHH